MGPKKIHEQQSNRTSAATKKRSRQVAGELTAADCSNIKDVVPNVTLGPLQLVVSLGDSTAAAMAMDDDDAPAATESSNLRTMEIHQEPKKELQRGELQAFRQRAASHPHMATVKLVLCWTSAAQQAVQMLAQSSGATVGQVVRQFQIPSSTLLYDEDADEFHPIHI